MHPYLLSREAHSTGLCDVSSADYFRTFSPRTRTAPAAHTRKRIGMAEGEGFEPPVPLLTQRFSRPSLSATQTALQTCSILQEQAHTREADGTGTGNARPRQRKRLGRAHTTSEGSLRHSPRSAHQEADPGVHTPRVRSQSQLSASQAEEVPGFLVGCRLLGVVEEAARERGGCRRPQRHADREHRLDRVVDVPA